MYDHEGIKWKHIKFVDNQKTLDMLATKPMNVLALIDEESKFLKVTNMFLSYKTILKYKKRFLKQHLISVKIRRTQNFCPD